MNLLSLKKYPIVNALQGEQDRVDRDDAPYHDSDVLATEDHGDEVEEVDGTKQRELIDELFVYSVAPIFDMRNENYHHYTSKTCRSLQYDLFATIRFLCNLIT